MRTTTRASRGSRALVMAVAATTALGLAACNRSSDSDTGSGGEAPVGVALITKDSTNPFFVAMQNGGKADAAKNNVKAHRRLRQAGRVTTRARSPRSRTPSPAATRASSSPR